MNVYFCNKKQTLLFDYDLHEHNIWEIIYQNEGVNTSYVGNNEFVLNAGDVLVIPPNVAHSGKSENGFKDMYIQVHDLSFNGVCIVHDYDGSILTLFNMLHKSLLQKEYNYSRICDAILDAIVQYIRKYSEKEYYNNFVYEAKNIIYENFSNSQFKISEISSKIGYNTDYFRRCFIREVGETPREYLNELRLTQAKKLLIQETFSSIKNIAFRCGFADSFYFSVFFKKKVGLSPSEYRKKFKYR